MMYPPKWEGWFLIYEGGVVKAMRANWWIILLFFSISVWVDTVYGFTKDINLLFPLAIIFFPSLVFGELRDRYQRTLPAILLHSFYNLGFYLTLIYR